MQTHLPTHRSIKYLLSNANSATQTNKIVCVKGWIRTRRDSNAGISFLALHDGSCFDTIQVVAPNTLENYKNEVLELTTGCSVEVVGTFIESQGKKKDKQSYEIAASQIIVHGFVADPENYPIQPKPHSLEYLRTVNHLRPRTNIIGAVTRLRNCLAQSIHRFLHAEDFLWIHTPIITSSDCEGAGEMFRVSTLDLNNIQYLPDLSDLQNQNNQKKIDFSKDFFGKESFLTVSGQLNVEAYCLAMSKVYTFGPTFRAENSNTSRHLSEFWMIEPEIAFANLLDDANLAESMLKYVFNAVLSECSDDLEFFNSRVDKNCIKRLENLIEKPFVHMTYTDGIEILKKSQKKFEYPVEWGIDLQSEHERYLAEEYINGPLVLMNYPKNIKSFYMRLNDDEKTVAAMDILVPGIGEIVGGSQREERLHILDQRMEEVGLDKKHYSWYLDLRRYGTVPHAGFGLGFERLVTYISGIANVRDVIPFPRTPGNCNY